MVFCELESGDDGGHECDRATSQAPLCGATNLHKTLHTPPALKLRNNLKLLLVLGLGDVGFKFSLALANLEQNMDILVLFICFGDECVQKSGISSYLRRVGLPLRGCKRLGA